MENIVWGWSHVNKEFPNSEMRDELNVKRTPQIGT